MPDFEHAAFLVEKQHVDGELHADGVNSLARDDPESFARFKLAVFQQTGFALGTGVGNPGAVGQRGATRGVADTQFRQDAVDLA